MVRIVPVNDEVAEPEETVIVNLVPRARYIIGAPKKATITIFDDNK